MVDAIISPVVENLTSILLSSIKEEAKLVTGVNHEVKKLVSNLKSIQALLDDAEEQQLKEASVKNWLFNLKAVSYDMDDVIDEWQTWIQTSKSQNQRGSDQRQLKHKVLSIFRCICFVKRDAGLRHVVARKIREFQQRMDDIATDKVRYQLSPSQKTEKYIERHMTTPLIDMQKVKGRDEEKDKVKSEILEAKSNPHIISLVGFGGIGKTTLAQLVYNDSDIQSRFENKIWVCVSEPFDEMRISKAIFESLCGSTHDFKELANVLEKITASLNKKRFLLVLDDVWNENRRKWEELEKIFNCGLPGSTILITTRNERVAIVMGCKPESIHKVGLLTSEECWFIISQIAHVQSDRQKLENIGRKIADKCKGLPLVATILGGLLCFKKSEKEWLRVLEKNEWEGEDALDSLKLSYYDLPLSLKQCFKYCAIFPKGSKISKRGLIGMWMAQGYLKGKEKDEDLEMIGEIYFDNLIARSLVQIPSYSEDCFVLHDMVSDLAQTFTKNECLMIEVLKDKELNGNSLHADVNVRHLTLTIENDVLFPRYIYDFTKLRTLIIQLLGYRSSLIVDTLKNIFDHLTCLRTLDLSSCDIEEIPSSIDRLVHLRWLDLSTNTNLEKVPETLCECYNLQTLILNWCQNLVELPQGIGKLINLMYLNIGHCSKIECLPKGIGNLWRLKELNEFIVGMYENGTSCIVEMEKLNNLRGSLKIRGLGNVRKLEEARKAQLMKKKNVTDLRLSFDRDHVIEDEEETVEGDTGINDEEELLEALKPPSDLEILSIREYKGKTLFPSWMVKLNLLRKLKIYRCENCEELPPLGKLSCLEELYLRDMKVKRVGVEFMGIEKEKDASTSFLSFPKLEILSFRWFSEWEEWDDIDEWLMERINNKTITVMPCLQTLNVYGCRKLKTLPYRLLSPPITTRLQQLYMARCDVLQQEVQKDKLSHIPYFTIEQGSLTIRGLGHVRKLEEARNQLMRGKYVFDLSLIFDLEEDEEEIVEGGNGKKEEEELLEALEPPSDLEILSIIEYKGKTLFPSWLLKLNLLWKLTIYNSGNCEELPPLGKLPCLEELYLENMGVKRVGVEIMGIEKEKNASTSFLSFPKLKILSFRGLGKWEEWDDLDEFMERINNKIITVMPCLQQLSIYNCPKLKTLPYHLLSPPITPTLQELDIHHCDVLEQEVQKDKLSHIPYFMIEQGSLTITGLGHVKKREEARKAQLMKRKNIMDLDLIFDVEEDGEETVEGDDGMKDEEELLEALEPPSDLERLYIREYKGKTLFPSWMMKLNLLRTLSISKCINFEELPPLGKLSCLEGLWLFDMGVKRVGVEFMGIEKEKEASTSFLSFPKLKILSFNGFSEWEEWDDIDEWLMERINNKEITIMPSLQSLFISKCRKLKTLPYHLLSPPVTTRLIGLNIYGCDVLQQEVQKDKLSHIRFLTIGSDKTSGETD